MVSVIFKEIFKKNNQLKHFFQSEEKNKYKLSQNMDKTMELVDQLVEIKRKEFDPIDMVDPSSPFDCIWTNNTILSQTVNNYDHNEMKMDQQILGSHSEESYKYQTSDQQNIYFKNMYDRNEHQELDQLLKEFEPTTEEINLLDYINDPNMPIQYDVEIEQLLNIFAEQFQPTTNQTVENRHSECVKNVENTTIDINQQLQKPLLKFDIVPVVTDGNILKFDCIQRITDEPVEKAKKSYKRKRTRITYNEQQLMVLRAKFAEDPYPPFEYFEEIAKKWNLEPHQIKFWFQNQRHHAKLLGVPTAKPLKIIRKMKQTESTKFEQSINEQHAVVLKGMFAVNPYPPFEYYEEMAKKWNLSPKKIEYWFRSERYRVKMAEAENGRVKIAKPLEGLQHPRLIESDFEQIEPELEPPTKKRAIDSNLVAIHENNIDFDGCDIASEYLMTIDDISNGSDQGFYSSDREIVQDPKCLQEQISDLSYFSSLVDDSNDPWLQIHENLMKYKL